MDSLPKIQTVDEWTEQHGTFVDAASAYCAFLDDTPEKAVDDGYFDELARKLLAVASPGVTIDYMYRDGENEDVDPYYVSADDEKALQSRLDKALGPLFEETRQMEREFEENIPHYSDRLSMAVNDLVEIYHDLLTGLRMWSLGTPEGYSGAAWFWRFSKWHWGDHLYRAMQSVHMVRARDMN